VVTIPNAADLDLFRPDIAPTAATAAANGGFMVLYAGTLGRANSSTELVDIASALARRRADDVRIVVIGDGYERANMERLATERGLANLVFLGKLPKTEVAAWHGVAAMTLCLFKPYPVLATCSPNKLFDSLAAGRPVLNNTDGWIRDLLSRTQTGESFAAGDAERAADQIVGLRDDAVRRRAMGERARQVAETEFARDTLALQFAELFRP
jgi:glycosyltransferase involved in cell wall biosynthesis